MPILADLLSFIDSTKRSVKGRLSDLMDNPVDYYQMVDDQAKNYNRTVQPTIQGGSLFNRPMTEAEKDQRSIDLALNVGPMGVGHIAYHGSPHKFDKFKTEAIGTGEGAQAYGHGLYLAESPAVATQYSKMADQNPTAIQYLNMFGGDKKKALAAFEAHIQDGAFGNLDPSKAKYIAEAISGRGQMYKTDIPDEAVARFLDWDKPLSQQAPEVQAALGDLALKNQAHIGRVPIRQFIYDKTQQTGSLPSVVIGEIEKAGSLDAAIPALQRKFSGANDAAKSKLDELLATLKQQQISMQTGVDSVRTGGDIVRGGYNPPEIAQMLQSKGIPGIRYLDGGSRSAGQGSSNFVAFDPEMIRILERNGQATGLEPWKPGEYRLKDLITK